MRFRLLFAFLLAACLANPSHAVDAEPAKVSQWNGFEQLDFTVADHAGLLVKPKTPADGKPWIWRTEFFGHEPQADLALLAAGWHVAYFKISDMWGAPPAIALMRQFHDHVTREYGLSRRVVLEGFSRGGLYAINFAIAHPDKTAGLYLDAPVLDILSVPGGRDAAKRDPTSRAPLLKAYGITEETAESFKGNPIDHLEPLVKARIPIISVVGDADKVVLLAENTAILKQRYQELGGKIEVIVKPGGDHHPHSLKDPKPIVDFLLANALR